MSRPNTMVSAVPTSRFAHRAVMVMAVGGVLVAGCLAAPTPPGAKPAPEVTLTPIDNRGLAEAVARHQGKVVLVDFWATWCAPCVKLFPRTVELQQRLADRGLVVISVSMDNTESREAVRRFRAPAGPRSRTSSANMVSARRGSRPSASTTAPCRI